MKYCIKIIRLYIVLHFQALQNIAINVIILIIVLQSFSDSSKCCNNCLLWVMPQMKLSYHFSSITETDQERFKCIPKPYFKKMCLKKALNKPYFKHTLH